jgi:hypothetical protein
VRRTVSGANAVDIGYYAVNAKLSGTDDDK